jgi:nicotinate-nucleotide--dimethylbenzimidazole phosphoribosyltransferase
MTGPSTDHEAEMDAAVPPPSFDAFRDLLAQMPPPNDEAAAAARERERQLTKPAGSLGLLEEIAEWLAAWQGRHPPKIDRPLAAVFAGNHGVVDQGISAYPQAVTAQMVANFQAGGAAVNQLCQTFGLGLKVYELALEQPTRDISREAAMDEAECAAAMAYGMAAVSDEPDLLCIGEMGIGNTTVAAAIAHALHGGRAEDWVGPGTGLDAAGMARKAEVVRRAVQCHAGHLDDPLEVLRRLGGREIAAICGAILAARLARVPVLVDGYVATAAAAILHAADATALDHCMAAHRSAEPAHGALLDRLGKRPILDLGMRLGEASGAVLAAATVMAAARVHAGMATFASAGVSGKEI